MRRVRPAVLGVAAGFGVALLALSVVHTTTVGNCANGPVPYQVTNPCPSNTGYWFGALFAAIAITAGALALLGGGFAGGVILLTVGGACVVALATGAARSSWLIAAIVLAVLFLPLGAAMVRAARRPPRRAAALLPLAALGALGAVAIALAIPGPLEEPKPASAAIPELTAADADSWFRSANLARALRTIRTTLGPSARLDSMTLQPAVAVISAVAGGTLHSYNFTVGREPEDYPSPASSGTRAAFAAVDTTAPQRLLAELRRRFHVAPAQVEHVDFRLDAVSNAPRWSAYLNGNTTFFEGDAHGEHLTRVTM